ncbi:MAG: co-chaperone GroES [Bdellovibrionales bacterium]|nr:co-chaperone GroES [Bdellovibrionales bacterium]
MSNVNFTPLADRVLVEPAAAEEKTASGIIIPDTAKEKPQKGEVVATGNGRVTDDGKTRPLEVKAGDKVLFSKYAGTDLKLGTEEFLMITEGDVLGILN